MKQLSFTDFEKKGFKSHWRFFGLYGKECVCCGYSTIEEDTPEVCSGCHAIMIMPEPTNRKRGIEP